MPAVKILDRKEMLPEGDVMKAIAWKIPESKDFPEGIKYAFAYIKTKEYLVMTMKG